MNTILKMAFLNTFRYRSRSVVTIVAVGISVFASILVDALLMGIIDQSTINLLRYEGAEVTVYSNGYLDEKDDFPNDIFIDAGTVAEISERLSGRVGFCKRSRSYAEIIWYNSEDDFEGVIGVSLFGVDAQEDGNVFAIPSTIIRGRWLENGNDEIVIGTTVADKLGLDVGDLVTVSTTGRGGFLETLDAQVVGIINTENAQVNSFHAFMPLDVLDDYLSFNGGVSQISVSDNLSSTATRAFRSKVADLLAGIDGIEIWYYEEDNAGLMNIMNGDKGSSYIVLFFLFIIAAAGIANIMVMSVLERRKECAMLLAQGFSRFSVTSMYVLEGLDIGIIGSLGGCLLGALVNIPLASAGLDLTPFVGEQGIDMGYRISLVIRTVWSARTFVGIPLIALCLTALSSWLPVRRLERGQIARMLRKA